MALATMQSRKDYLWTLINDSAPFGDSQTKATSRVFMSALFNNAFQFAGFYFKASSLISNEF